MKPLGDEEKLYISAELFGIEHSYKDYSCLYEYIFGAKVKSAKYLKKSNHLLIEGFKNYWNSNGRLPLVQIFSNQPELLHDKKTFNRLTLVAEFIFNNGPQNYVKKIRTLKAVANKKLEIIANENMKKAHEELYEKIKKNKKTKTVIKSEDLINVTEWGRKQKSKNEFDDNWWREQE